MFFYMVKVCKDSHGGGVTDEAEVGIKTDNLGLATMSHSLVCLGEKLQHLNVKEVQWKGQMRGGRGEGGPERLQKASCQPCGPLPPLSCTQTTQILTLGKKEAPAAEIDDSVTGSKKVREAELLSPGQACQVVHCVQPDNQFCLKSSWSEAVFPTC